MNRIALVTHTTSYGAAGFVEACRRAGTGVVLASDRCHVLDRAWHWPADSLVIDFGDPDAAAALIAAANAGESPISAVLAVGGELPAKVAAAAARRLGLPANAPGAMASAANKLLMRRQLAAAAAVDASVRQPHFIAVACGTPADEVARRVTASDGVGFPCVVKPLALSGSRGVMRADDEPSLAAAVARLERLLADPAVRRVDPEAAGQFLVESFVAGPEFALEGLLTHGALHVLALFDKPDPLDGPTFEETLYVTPSRLPADRQRRIEETVAAAALALGLETGPIHAELRWSRGDDAPVLIAPGAGGLRPPEPMARGAGPTEGPTLIASGEGGLCPPEPIAGGAGPFEGPVLIEMAARPIGGLCSRSLRFEDGLSLEDVVVRHALGTDAVPTRQGRASGVMMIPIPARVPSALRTVAGVDDARAVAGIEDVVISVRVGETLVPLPEGASYTGFVFASGETAADVEQALREATSRLKFTVAPLVPVTR